MKSFTESRLRFSFDASWSVVGQWDRHDAFTRGLRNHQNTGGVDFIGLLGSEPYFIEVKNFRDFRIPNKERPLHVEVADKVRDTIAGLVWAMDRGLDVADLSRVLREVFAAKRKCNVVFWLEEDRGPRPVARSPLAEAIKGRLQWLNPRVIVLSRTDRPLPGLEVAGAAAGE